MVFKLWYRKCKFLSSTDRDLDAVGLRRDPGTWILNSLKILVIDEKWDILQEM